jgi:glycosyltransferase involved in cell wall biosynthesis
MTNDHLRIMSFLTTFEVGGTERQCLNLALGLNERGFDVRFGCFRQAGRLRDELDARGIPITEYSMRSFYSGQFVRRQLALARELRSRRTQIMQAYNLHGNVFAIPAARLARVPLVVAGVRDCGVYLTDWTQRVQRHVCRLADLIIVNAEGIKTWLVGDGYKPEKIAVIRNGIDLSRFLNPVIEDPGGIRREFGIPADAPLISHVARLCPTKGFDDTVEAMAVVHQRHPDAHLIIVGEQLTSDHGKVVSSDVYRNKLAARARALGVGHRVIFAGHRSDVPAIQHEATVAAHPSLTEGLSNSVLESMASGAAVVATPVGGTPEIIEHDRTGWLVPPSTPRALGDALCALIEDPARRLRLGQAAKAFVRDAFSIPRMVTATEEVYRAALERKRADRSGRPPATPLPWGGDAGAAQ